MWALPVEKHGDHAAAFSPAHSTKQPARWFGAWQDAQESQQLRERGEANKETLDRGSRLILMALAPQPLQRGSLWAMLETAWLLFGPESWAASHRGTTGVGHDRLQLACVISPGSMVLGSFVSLAFAPECCRCFW